MKAAAAAMERAETKAADELFVECAARLITITIIKKGGMHLDIEEPLRSALLPLLEMKIRTAALSKLPVALTAGCSLNSNELIYDPKTKPGQIL